MTKADSHFAALWPRGPRQAKVKPLAKRLDTLEGKTVAWVWDYVFRGNEVFEQLEASMRERYPGVKFLHWDLFGNTHGSDERNNSKNSEPTPSSPGWVVEGAARPPCCGPVWRRSRWVSRRRRWYAKVS